MLEPSIVILYVNNLTKSREFYQDLLGIKSEELSPSFNQFTLSNGMCLGLKIKDTIEPPVTEKNGGGELAFTLDDPAKIDELFATLKIKGIAIAQPPTSMTFGYNFLAIDPDGNRLRFCSLRKS